MADGTSIEWTDATWNPVVGCSVVSPGCSNCYAMRQAPRTDALSSGAPWAGNGGPLTQHSKAGPVWTGAVRLVERRLDQPLHWRRPRKIFVNSMGDLFHESVPDDWIDRIFAVMALAPQHTFQVLTKRAARMRAYFDGCDLMRDLIDFSRPWSGITGWHRRHGTGEAMRELGERGHSRLLGKCYRLPLPNLWLGVSVEDQQRADERIPHLLATPAAVRFISAEPLLGPIDLSNLREGTYDAMTGCGDRERLYEWEPTPRLDWVIAGSESGPNARPCDLEWIRSLRDQCSAAGVPLFWKQHVIGGRKLPTPELDGRTWMEFPQTTA